MEIIRATHLGMCFGVRDAIALAQTHAALQPITVLGQLVHNEDVLADLKVRGVRVAKEPKSVETAVAMITAHGASDHFKDQARKQGLSLIDATCPLVKSAHRALQNLVARGYYPVIIGQRDHVEVKGLSGDLMEFQVVLTSDEVRAVPERPRYGVISQTTQPIARVRSLVEQLKEVHPQSEVEFVDTVCQPTKLRQQAAQALAEDCDVVIVVGGAQSNNTRELVRTCGLRGATVYHVQRPEDLSPAWFENATKVGLTAGTSTPDATIQSVAAQLDAWCHDKLITSNSPTTTAILAFS